MNIASSPGELVIVRGIDAMRTGPVNAEVRTTACKTDGCLGCNREDS